MLDTLFLFMDIIFMATEGITVGYTVRDADFKPDRMSYIWKEFLLRPAIRQQERKDNMGIFLKTNDANQCNNIWLSFLFIRVDSAPYCNL